MTCITETAFGIRCDCALLVGALRNALRHLGHKPFRPHERMFIAWLVVAVDHAHEVTTVVPVDVAPDVTLDDADIRRLIGTTMNDLAEFMGQRDEQLLNQKTGDDMRAWAGTVAGMILTMPRFWHGADLPDAWLAAPSPATA